MASEMTLQEQYQELRAWLGDEVARLEDLLTCLDEELARLDNAERSEPAA